MCPRLLSFLNSPLYLKLPFFLSSPEVTTTALHKFLYPLLKTYTYLKFGKVIDARKGKRSNISFLIVMIYTVTLYTLNFSDFCNSSFCRLISGSKLK